MSGTDSTLLRALATLASGEKTATPAMAIAMAALYLGDRLLAQGEQVAQAAAQVSEAIRLHGR